MKLIKHIGLSLATLALMAACTGKQQVFSDAASKIEDAKFETTMGDKQVKLYTLTSEGGIAMKVTNFGARIVALCVPDKDGNLVDVVLGYNALQDYETYGEKFYGAAIGRYGNRIALGKFSIDSVEYQLPQNDGMNHLHGGPAGYFDMVWDATQVSPSKIEFKYLSPDGEQGYPGNLSITMAYELKADRSVEITYSATTDKKTILNLTNHSYFNLSGEGAETINDHLMQINADFYTPVDSTLIPTGELAQVAGTPMDFNTPTAIGDRAGEAFQQLVYGGGYDHNWVVRNNGEALATAATVYSPVTGIQLDVITSEPGIQFYAGNFMDGKDLGKSGKPYGYRAAFCLETQHFPDSPNKPEFPSTILEPGQTYSHTCIYKFSVKQ
jgi:aldose 1-epimerase